MDELLERLRYKSYLSEQEESYWTNEYLAKQSLESKIDESNHFGSRGSKFVKKSVNWIKSTFYSEQAH